MSHAIIKSTTRKNHVTSDKKRFTVRMANNASMNERENDSQASSRLNLHEKFRLYDVTNQ